MKLLYVTMSGSNPSSYIKLKASHALSAGLTRLSRILSNRCSAAPRSPIRANQDTSVFHEITSVARRTPASIQTARGLVQLPGVDVRADERGGDVPKRDVHGNESVPDDRVAHERMSTNASQAVPQRRACRSPARRPRARPRPRATAGREVRSKAQALPRPSATRIDLPRVGLGFALGREPPQAAKCKAKPGQVPRLEGRWLRPWAIWATWVW